MPLPLIKEFKPGISQVKKVIAIAAGKGGVGKSSVTAHLAYALKEAGHRVGVLDIDLYGPSQGMILSEDQPISEQGSSIIPAMCDGIKMVSFAQFRSQASVIRAPMAGKILNQFLQSVFWGELDYLFVDFPPGTGDIPLSFVQSVPVFGAVLVTTPQEIAVLDVKKAGEMFLTLSVPLLGIVENFSYMDVCDQRVFPFGQGGGEKLARHFSVRILAKLPLDPSLSLALDSGKTAFHGDRKGVYPFLEMKSAFINAVKAEDEREKPHAFAIDKVWQQKDDSLFIVWKDGLKQKLYLKDIQAKCPCAGCKEGATSSAPDLRVKNIMPIGRYALKIEFTSGCSKGLYDLALLRSIGKEAHV